jgi:hypothetical protein
MGDTVKFVDSIASSPTTRLDLNDGATWKTDLAKTEFPPAPIRRSVVSTLLADGARVPAAAYDNRTVRLGLTLLASGADAQATQIQTLARELDRPVNILMWQPTGATNPIFLRTLRSNIAGVQELRQSLRFGTVEIMAEPFALGLKQTLAPVTVNNDPAAGSNGCFWEVTSVKGDMETPVVLRMAADKVYDATKKQSLFAVRRRGTPSSAPFLVQAEACTQGTNTTTQANDATYSGAGNNFSRCTFAAATNSLRLTLPAPSDSTNLRGTYRLWVRYKKSVAADPVQVQAKWNGAVYTNDQVTLASSTLFRWADLGLVSMPSQPDPVYDGYSNVEQSVSGQTVEFWAARSSGTTNLDVDFFLYVPADDNYCLVKWTSVNNASYEAVLDGVAEAAYILDAGDAIENVGANELVGGLPMISPGQTNRIVFLRDVGTTSGASDAVTGTTDITLAYWPRYAYIRPSAT